MDGEGSQRGGGLCINLSIRGVAQWRDFQRCRAKGVCLGGLFMGLMWMAVRSGEDGSLVETRGWGCNGKSLRNHWGEN